MAGRGRALLGAVEREERLLGERGLFVSAAG